MDVTRKRGSLVDTISLEEYPFMFEPQLRDKLTTVFARQAVIGNRLPHTYWVGSGDSAIELDIYLLGNPDTMDTVNGIKALADPQDDTGAPHPLFVNVGGLYTGMSFVLYDADTRFEVFEYSDDMAPREATMRLRLFQLAPASNYAGAGK